MAVHRLKLLGLENYMSSPLSKILDNTLYAAYNRKMDLTHVQIDSNQRSGQNNLQFKT